LPDHAVLYEFEEPAALVTLNRPRRFNALDEGMLEGIAGAFVSAEATAACRAVILTGAGRAFCWGADLAALVEGGVERAPARLRELLPRYQRVIRLIVDSPLPVIAAINGFATGAGLDLALACDLRVAERRARLGEAFAQVGLVPDGGGTWFLPRLVGPAVATEMALTGEPLEAERAHELGLVNRVVAAADLLPSARALAELLAGRDREVLAETKRLLRENLGRDLPAALEAEAEAQFVRAGTPSFASSVRKAARRLRSRGDRSSP
jgi:enoyl-CoA hydratase/carnithine racemase